MPTHFQDINKISQRAVAEAKEFIDEHDGDFSEDDVSSHITYVENNMVNIGHSGSLINLYKQIFAECVECWVQLEAEELQDDNDED